MKSTDHIAALISRSTQQHPNGVTGRWHNLQIKPDLGSGEILNLGVVFVDEGNRVHLRVAQELPRLQCLYDNRVDVSTFERLSLLIERAFDGASLSDFKLSELTPHATLTEGRFASGPTIRDILDNFYEATVPLGRPAPALLKGVRAPRAKSISNEEAKRTVLESLVRRMGPRALPFIAPAPYQFSELNGEVHKVEVPIRAPGRLSASVVSLWTTNEYRRKFQLAQAGLNLDMIRKQSPSERLGLFVMRPMEEEGYSSEELAQIDNDVDEASWQLRRVANIDVNIGEDSEDLSEKLEEWLEAA